MSHYTAVITLWSPVKTEIKNNLEYKIYSSNFRVARWEILSGNYNHDHFCFSNKIAVALLVKRVHRAYPRHEDQDI
ncbi:unnamed protein product [Gadus morhua 'NCC']